MKISRYTMLTAVKGRPGIPRRHLNAMRRSSARGWPYGRRNPAVSAAIEAAWSKGKKLPKNIAKLQQAGLKDLLRRIERDGDRKALESALIQRPRLLVSMYMRYPSINALIEGRKLAKTGQTPWTEERREQAAKTLLMAYGGMPSIGVLQRDSNRVSIPRDGDRGFRTNVTGDSGAT